MSASVSEAAVEQSASGRLLHEALVYRRRAGPRPGLRRRAAPGPAAARAEAVAPAGDAARGQAAGRGGRAHPRLEDVPPEVVPLAAQRLRLEGEQRGQEEQPPVAQAQVLQQRHHGGGDETLRPSSWGQVLNRDVREHEFKTRPLGCDPAVQDSRPDPLDFDEDVEEGRAAAHVGELPGWSRRWRCGRRGRAWPPDREAPPRRPAAAASETRARARKEPGRFEDAPPSPPPHPARRAASAGVDRDAPRRPRGRRKRGCAEKVGVQEVVGGRRDERERVAPSRGRGRSWAPPAADVAGQGVVPLRLELPRTRARTSRRASGRPPSRKGANGSGTLRRTSPSLSSRSSVIPAINGWSPLERLPGHLLVRLTAGTGGRGPSARRAAGKSSVFGSARRAARSPGGLRLT